MELTSRDLMTRSLQHLHDAFQADCGQQFKVAVLMYMEGAPLLLQLAREEGLSHSLKQLLKCRCQQYLDRIHVIKAKLDAGEDVPANTAIDRTRPNMDGFDSDTREVIQSWTELPLQPKVGEVKGVRLVKDFLWTNIVIPLIFPGLPASVTRVKHGVLFYGLPGTGKTMLLCAMATAIACPVVRVTASDLITHSCGPDWPVQMVRNLFMWARQNQPCVVCLDDLDVLCNPHLDTESSVTREVREELTAQLKGVCTDCQVTVVAASQKPWYLGGALRRRFDRRFHLALPQSVDRRQIFAHCMAHVQHQLSEDDLDRIGHLTSGYTGADMVVLARACEVQAVRVLQRATHFCKVSMTLTEDGKEVTREMMTPCDAGTCGAIEITLEFLNPQRLCQPVVTMATVETELCRMQPSCSDLDFKKMNQWLEEFGQED